MKEKIRTGTQNAFLAIVFAAATSGWAWADARDAIAYSLDGDDLRISGPFSASVDFVTIHGVFAHELEEGATSASGAHWDVHNLFQVRIGDDFLELFGDSTEIDLETYAGGSWTGALPYDYASLRGACLRRANGQMVLMIDLKQGGTANAGKPPDTVFIFADDDEKVRFDVINRDDWTDAACLDEARQAAEVARQVRRQQSELMAANTLGAVELRYNEAGRPASLGVVPLPDDPRPDFLEHFNAHSGYYHPTYCMDKADRFIEECAKTQSGIEQVFGSDRYDIHRARFIRDCASEGIDLLHDKSTGSWTALFRNVTGCSKHYLCEPEYRDLDGRTLSADIPVDCIHWGAWEPVRINLETFAVIRN